MRDNFFLLTFPGDHHWVARSHSHLSQILKEGDVGYVVDRNLVFVRTSLTFNQVVAGVEQTLGDAAQFFIVDITKSDRAGSMVPRFWEFLRASDAAEVA